MEAIFTRYHPFHQRLDTSPPPHNHRRGLNFRYHVTVGRTPAMKPQTIQRITTALKRSPRNPIQFSLTNTSHLNPRFDSNFSSTIHDSDADKESKPVDRLSVAKDTIHTNETQKSPEIPPPPEKPLPGDCCGSGCVRCVWDVYIEELAEYNKLYNRE